ncbi:MAG: DUF47 family protein [Deltaproteobacteria bacterium]|nr:DUF47 family protein [Deltaproteobacteria bacterium]
MFFFSKKKNDIQTQVNEYLELAQKCIEKCVDSFETFYINNGSGENFFRECLKPVHKFESQCDDKRMYIEYIMYEKSLLSESRGDILTILEVTDRLPNKAEMVIREIYKSDLTLPDEFKERFHELFLVNIKAAFAAVWVVKAYFESPKSVVAIHEKIDKLESQSDVMQMHLERAITISQIPDLQKIFLKKFINMIGMLSDVSENISERIKILSVKTVF